MSNDELLEKMRGIVREEIQAETKPLKQAVDKLAEQTAQTKQEVTQLLAIAHEIKKHTIDQILARDDVALAFDVLSGKLKRPK